MYVAMQSTFPEHNWKNPAFLRSAFYMSVPEHRRLFIDKIAKQLDIKKPEDWYTVSNQQVVMHGGAGLLRYHHNSLREGNHHLYSTHIHVALIAILPEKQWEAVPRKKLPESPLLCKDLPTICLDSIPVPLRAAVRTLFPNNNVLVNFRAFHTPNLVYDVSFP